MGKELSKFRHRWGRNCQNLGIGEKELSKFRDGRRILKFKREKFLNF
jgi:hypothetical protein